MGFACPKEVADRATCRALCKAAGTTIEDYVSKKNAQGCRRVCTCKSAETTTASTTTASSSITTTLSAKASALVDIPSSLGSRFQQTANSYSTGAKQRFRTAYDQSVRLFESS